MVKTRHTQTLQGVLTHRLLKAFVMYPSIFFLALLLLQSVRASFATIPETVKAPETIHSVLGLDTGRSAGGVAVDHPEHIVGEHRMAVELKKSHTKRPLEQAVRKGPDFVKPTDFQVKILDNSAFRAVESLELQQKLKYKTLQDLADFKPTLRVNPHLDDQAISLKDDLLDFVYQVERVIQGQETRIKTLENEYDDYDQKRRTAAANIKAVILDAMIKKGVKETTPVLAFLKKPKDIMAPERGVTEWMSAVRKAEQEYKMLYETSDNFIVRFIKRIFQPKKWRQERMLKDFHKIRMANLEGAKDPKERLILEIEQVLDFGLKISRNDQSLIHQIAKGYKTVRLSETQLARLERLQQEVTQLLDRIRESNETPHTHHIQRLAASTHAILKSKSQDELTQTEKELLAKLETYSTRQYDIERDPSSIDPLTFSREELELVETHVKVYDNILSDIRRYSKPRALQINEIDLDDKFAETQTRAREVLKRISADGVATAAQQKLLAEQKPQARVATPQVTFAEESALAETFWERHVNLSPKKKAQWIANLITPELEDEFSIDESVLERIKNIGLESEWNSIDEVQIKHLAKFHDELLAAMSKQERAFQELLAQNSNQANEKSLRDLFDTRLRDRFREVSYARLYWSPTKQERVLERLNFLKAKGIPLSKEQTKIFEKLETNQPLLDDENSAVDQLAIDSVLSQDSKATTEVEETALKLVYEYSMKDLSDNYLALFQNLKDAEIRELTRLGSLPADSKEFRKYSKFSQVSQILKRAGERRALDWSPSQINLIHLVGKTEMDIRKIQTSHLKSLKNTLKWEIRGANTFKIDFLHSLRN